MESIGDGRSSKIPRDKTSNTCRTSNILTSPANLGVGTLHQVIQQEEWLMDLTYHKLFQEYSAILHTPYKHATQRLTRCISKNLTLTTRYRLTAAATIYTNVAALIREHEQEFTTTDRSVYCSDTGHGHTAAVPCMQSDSHALTLHTLCK
jgi:hypothetical protein